mmetsp:Transcript_7892/g.23492  ORF Transcript_7892/g.23492 Transcript_7892/m.23492 type:complete len:549 (-) Transcript_7892:35-1681(-)
MSSLLRSIAIALVAASASALAPVQTLRATPATQKAAAVMDAPTAVPDAVSADNPLRVVIAGAGVGGLTLANALGDCAHVDVTLVEKTSAFKRFGGPIQLASNAMQLFRELDRGLYDEIESKFTWTGNLTNGIKDGIRDEWYAKFDLASPARNRNMPYTGVIERPDLQEILLGGLKEGVVRNGNGVGGYERSGSGVTVALEDGSQIEADVLVGADGIWSAVRRQMYDEGPVRGVSKDGKVKQGCAYSGYTVFAGEAVLPLADYYDVGYNVYIGPQRYFVKSDVGDGRVQWYAFCALPAGSAKAGDSWDEGATSEAQGRSVVDYIKGLHEGWTDEIGYILDRTPAASVEQRDLYDRWPEFFRSWASGRVVLLGDAVHPMMPNLGQGGCQAIEDAYELGKHLSAATTFEKKADRAEVEKALQDFYRDRMPRVAGVSLLSRLASDLIINAFDTPWNPWGDGLGMSWKSYLTFFWKPVLQYLIFPGQFLFLYSYHPSGPMGDLPKKLEEKWRARHRESAERAFAEAAKTGVAFDESARRGSFLAEEEPVPASR